MKQNQQDGQGTCVYDASYDILTFRTGLWYHHSLEIGHFVVDLDEQEGVSGLRVFDASQTLGIDASFLSRLSAHDLSVQLEDGMVDIRLSLVGKKGERSTHQVRMPVDVQRVSTG